MSTELQTLLNIMEVAVNNTRGALKLIEVGHPDFTAEELEKNLLNHATVARNASRKFYEELTKEKAPVKEPSIH